MNREFMIEKRDNSYYVVAQNGRVHIICSNYRKAARIIKEYEDILEVIR